MGNELTTNTTLTEKQRIFVRECARGVPPAVAAALAGYSQPEQTSYNLKSNLAVQSAIVAEVRRFLHVEAGPASITTLYNFMMDEKLDTRLRITCAKTLGDRAGFIAPKAKDASSLENKSLVDMTADEMREMASRIQKELSDRAVVVIDNAPQEGAQPSQAIDMFD